MSKPTYVPEYQAIVEVLNKYNEGCKQARSSIMKPAFSDKATMFSVDGDGKLSGGAIQALFDGIDSGFRPSPEARSPKRDRQSRHRRHRSQRAHRHQRRLGLLLHRLLSPSESRRPMDGDQQDLPHPRGALTLQPGIENTSKMRTILI